MPTEATVYRALLAMADDIDQERTISKDVIINLRPILRKRSTRF